MLKYFLTVLACASGLLLPAQAVKLARPLTEKDRLFLDQKLLGALSLGENISFSYENSDLYEAKKHDDPCSKRDIDSLVKLLKGNASDAVTYLNISGFYKRLHKPYEADTCSKKALALQSAVILAHPDSAAAYNLQSLIYMSVGDFQNAKVMTRRGLQLNPLDTTVACTLPMIHILAGEIDSARWVLKEQIKAHGDGFYSYDILPLCDFYGFMFRFSQTDEAGQEAFMNDVKEHSIIDFSLIEPYYRQDTASVHKSLLYHVARYLNTELRIIFVNARDTTSFADGRLKIILSRKDQQELAEAERFFKACLTNKNVKNKYYPYKVLGGIYFIEGNYKKAAEFTKKAIEAKPLSKSRLQINASEDYHNLYSIYILAKDTASAANLALEMIRIKPAIDSSATDLALAARACLHKKNYEKAKSLYLTAVSFGDRDINTWLGLSAACFLLKDQKQAAYYLDKAYSTDNTNSAVYTVSGIMSLEQEKVDDAYFMLNKSLELDKSNKWIEKDLLKKYIATQ